MGLQVEVGAVGDALQLTPLAALEVEPVLDVHGALGVVGQLLLRVVEVPQVGAVDTEIDVPVGALVDPILMPFLVGARLDEEFHLHLLEFARAEDEVAGGDLVAERLPDLTDAERRLLARRTRHIVVVDEDALGRLRTQVVQPRFVLHRPEERLEQPAEFLRLRPLATGAAVPADDVGHAVRRRAALLLLVFLEQMVLAIPLVAVGAFHQRVGEGGDVTRGDPDLARQDHGRVKSDDVLPGPHHVVPPLALDVVLQFDAQRPVIPGGLGASVDLAGGVDEAAALRQRDDGIDLGVVLGGGHN